MPGNNAYGSKAARNKVLRGVESDIAERDSSDIRNPRTPKKTYDEAWERYTQSAGRAARLRETPVIDRSLTPQQKSQMTKQGDAQRERLMTGYGTNPGAGLPSMRATVSSGDRASGMNTADMRGMKMINEGPMSPNDMRAMGDYGKKVKRK